MTGGTIQLGPLDSLAKTGGEGAASPGITPDPLATGPSSLMAIAENPWDSFETRDDSRRDMSCGRIGLATRGENGGVKKPVTCGLAKFHANDSRGFLRARWQVMFCRQRPADTGMAQQIPQMICGPPSLAPVIFSGAWSRFLLQPLKASFRGGGRPPRFGQPDRMMQAGQWAQNAAHGAGAGEGGGQFPGEPLVDAGPHQRRRGLAGAHSRGGPAAVGRAAAHTTGQQGRPPNFTPSPALGQPGYGYAPALFAHHRGGPPTTESGVRRRLNGIPGGGHGRHRAARWMPPGAIATDGTQGVRGKTRREARPPKTAIIPCLVDRPLSK